MPTIPPWLGVAITIASMIFAAGGTWAMLKYKQAKGDDAITSLVKDLKDCVAQLRGVVTEVEIIKVTNARIERVTEDHDKRIGALEVAVAKQSRTPTRRKG